jgi:hypothetical protein
MFSFGVLHSTHRPYKDTFTFSLFLHGAVEYSSFVSSTAVMYRVSEKYGTNGNFIYYLLFTLYALYQTSATYGTRAKRDTWNDFQWHAEGIEIQYMIS